MGVPGVATEPEAASAQLSIPRLRLPVRSRLSGRKSGWQHTCERMGAGGSGEGWGPGDGSVACPRGDKSLIITLSTAGSAKCLCLGLLCVQAWRTQTPADLDIAGHSVLPNHTSS